MRLRVFDLAENSVLSGAANGAASLAKVISTLPQDAEGVIEMDFEGVELATGSYLREFVLGFRDYCRRSLPQACPIVANANDAIMEELIDQLKSRRDALVVCRLDRRGRALEPKVIGILEQKQRLTLKAVLDLGEADAATLAEKFDKEDPIGVNGWNNRLAALAAKGVLAERRSGRSKLYRPVVEGLSYGA